MKKDPDILRESDNPKELVNTARMFAASPDPADQKVVGRHLGSAAFLDKLDPPEAYQVYKPHQLGAARIVKTLIDADAQPQRDTIVGLTASDEFNKRDPLIELLIRSLAADKPASDKTIAYWEKHASPESVYADNVVAAIMVNQSRPAMDLFERLMNDPKQDDEYKYAWLRDKMLRKRNDTPILACCERMVLQNTLVQDWHEPVIEAVFTWQPGWYGSCRKPNPPMRVMAPEESKNILERLGRHTVENMELVDPSLEPKVRMAMKEIGRELDEEQPDEA
jgi:hypothetical protein